MLKIKISNEIIDYIVKIGSSLLVLLIGFFVIKVIEKILSEIMKSNKMEPALQSFIKSAIGIILKIMLVITSASMAGVQMTSFVALLGAAGLAIGLAFQGTLSNFASGVLILIFRPFNVGDFIDSQGNKGVVEEIQVLYTSIVTEDRRKIIMPNSSVYSNIIAIDSSKGKKE